jgi:hypothetical protein
MSPLWSSERPALVGVVHLLPLPGSPRPSPGLSALLERAVRDAAALAEGGADAVIVENFGDAPFDAERVPPATVATMTRVALAVQGAAPSLSLGLNVLRNDALAALGIAAAVGAEFIRVNVHVGAMVTDQGLIQGRARETLLERNRLGAQVRVAADVLVKHAVPLGSPTLEEVAADTASRGLADALVVTGAGTGKEADPDHLARLRRALPSARVWLGSGIRPDNAARFRGLHGAIVGTWLHRGSDLDQPVDAARVRQMRAALDDL